MKNDENFMRRCLELGRKAMDKIIFNLILSTYLPILKPLSRMETTLVKVKTGSRDYSLIAYGIGGVSMTT
jgi:hypothetical protein